MFFVKDYLFYMLVILFALYIYGRFTKELVFKIVNWLNKRQLDYIESGNKQKVIKLIKIEFSLTKILYVLTPYFPYIQKCSAEFGNLIIRENGYKTVLKFILDKLFRPQLLNILVLILCMWVHKINITLIYKNQFLEWLIKLLKDPKNYPGLIVGLLIIISIFFTSRFGIIFKSLNKIRSEDFDNIIKFHHKNRILLTEIASEGNRNLDKVFSHRKLLQKFFKEDQINYVEEKQLKSMFSSLEELKGLDELYDFLQSNKNISYHFPFLKIRNKYFADIHHIYYGDSDSLFTIKAKDKLKEIYYAKSYFQKAKDQYSKFYKVNEVLLENLKHAVEINQYLKSASNMFNKSNPIFSVLAFITNKDSK